MYTRRFKDVSDFGVSILSTILEEELSLNKYFPNQLKLADVTPIFVLKKIYLIFATLRMIQLLMFVIQI